MIFQNHLAKKIFPKMKPPAFLLIFTGAILIPLFSHAQSARNNVALQQEVEAMRGEIQRLRLEVEDLKIALEQNRTRTNGTDVQRQLNTQTAATTQALQAQRTEIFAEMDRRIKAFGDETNRAMASLTKQVNDALRTSPVTPQNPPPPMTPPATPADMPQNGITYKVKNGDSISKIAREQKSKINWILAANNLPATATLQVGQTLFIPQRDDTATPTN